jgi:excisionase family DNA binding protein
VAGVTGSELQKLVAKELADNALDATGACGIGLLKDGSGLWVEDDGPGIPGTPEEIAALFSIRRPLTSSKQLRLPTRNQNRRKLTEVAQIAQKNDFFQKVPYEIHIWRLLENTPISVLSVLPLPKRKVKRRAMISEPHLNAAQTSKRIGVTVSRVYQLAISQELESHKIGSARLFPQSAVDAFQRQPRGPKPRKRRATLAASFIIRCARSSSQNWTKNPNIIISPRLSPTSKTKSATTYPAFTGTRAAPFTTRTPARK